MMGIGASVDITSLSAEAEDGGGAAVVRLMFEGRKRYFTIFNL